MQDPLLLSRSGSLFVTRPTLNHYIETPNQLAERCRDLFGWLAQGKVCLFRALLMSFCVRPFARRSLAVTVMWWSCVVVPSWPSQLLTLIPGVLLVCMPCPPFTQISVRIAAEFDLADAAEAHRFLEGRQAEGKVLLKIAAKL